MTIKNFKRYTFTRIMRLQQKISVHKLLTKFEKIEDYRHVADTEDLRKLKREAAEGMNGVGEAVNDKPTWHTTTPGRL